MKRLFSIILSLLLLIPTVSILTFAEDTTADFSKTEILTKGFDYPEYLSDGKERTYSDSEEDGVGTITLKNPDGIYGIYVVFDKIYGEWTISSKNNEKTVSVGKMNFLHEYVNIKELFGSPQNELTLTFENNAYIADVYGFGSGETPDWVQMWEAPLEKADILLLSSHSDDEQLFFAGILPYYAGERDVDVQVVYLISHFDTHERPHEQLNGLWAVGIRNYPIISDFPDLFSESLDDAIAAFEQKGYTYEDFTSYIVENIRRFKPQVLITHDVAGEYSHGTHIYCTDVVINSIDKTSDSSFCPESAAKWGTWDVPKTYLHLYENNKIVMNWDIPLESFGGKTAFEMSVIGFSYHKSQHWTWFNDWIHGKSSNPVTKATDIKTYSPCLYGLYRTTVGNDMVGGDFLENIVPYNDQIPPETTAPETEKNTDSSVPPAETQQLSEDEKTSPINKSIILIGLIVIVVIIILILYYNTTNKKRRRYRNYRR